MTSIKEDMEELGKKVNLITDHLKDEEIKRVKKKEFKLPGGAIRKAKMAVKKNKVLAVILRDNKHLQFRLVTIIGGLIFIDKYKYKLYESDAVYIYKNKIPVVVLIENRLLPVGGVAEEVKFADIGGEKDEKFTKKHNLGDEAQQTIIRAMEQAAQDIDVNKKKTSPIMLIVIVGIVIVILGALMGWF